MVKAGAVDKGMYLLVKGTPHLVTEREFVNPGKGSAFVRLKLKNIRTGLVVRQGEQEPGVGGRRGRSTPFPRSTCTATVTTTSS